MNEVVNMNTLWQHTCLPTASNTNTLICYARRPTYARPAATETRTSYAPKKHDTFYLHASKFT